MSFSVEISKEDYNLIQAALSQYSIKLLNDNPESERIQSVVDDIAILQAALYEAFPNQPEY